MVRVLFILSYFIFLNSITVLKCENSEHKHRIKRKIAFSKSSKFFFRLNGKDNMFNHTEIFAHGWTFRVNYDLPENIPKRHQFFKRDVHAELNTVSDESTFNVYSCILKYLCDSVDNIKISEDCGILCGIGNIIASSATMESNFFKSFLDNCDYHTNNCPYVFTDSSVNVV